MQNEQSNNVCRVIRYNIKHVFNKDYIKKSDRLGQYCNEYNTTMYQFYKRFYERFYEIFDLNIFQRIIIP